MKYKKLGKLPLETIDFFKKELLSRKISDDNYQWIQFDRYLNDEFSKIFCNTELKVQYDLEKNRYVQKAFYSKPNHGFGIHRDGHRCNSALNIAISCNPDDWVRWYDHDYIDSISNVSHVISNKGKSRNVDIVNYEDIPYIEELRNEVGDVYTLDVDTYHSFKCNGTEPRIIIQTKFANFPTFDTITESLERSSFINLIK